MHITKCDNRQTKIMELNSKDARILYDSLVSYIQLKHESDIEAILKSTDFDHYFTIPVHATSIFDHSLQFAHLLFKNPACALNLLEKAINHSLQAAHQNHEFKDEMRIKRNVRACLTSLPVCPEVYRTILPTPKDVGQFFCIIGTIVRCTPSKMLEYRKKWRCTKCKYEFTTDGTVEQNFSIVKPNACENHDECRGKTFTLISPEVNRKWCKDYQEVKLQEQVHNLPVGTLPRSMWVVLLNDLVDSCQAGNDVIVSGVLETRWQPVFSGCRTDIELVLVAHNVEVKNNNSISGQVSDSVLKEFENFWSENQNDPLCGRDFILSCLCPQVYGLYLVKLAVALLLAGGVERIDNANSKIRGDIHLLLVGDPGTGKSQFLRYVAKVGRRTILTSGVGTTNAGLTCAAVKDGGKWQLEAGALVLADGGVCCIDEFNSMKEQDKASIHEAMEQQTISVAKAGLVCKLSSRCSVLASTNPKGKYDKYVTLSANVAMASPLLSRFDIILVLLDGHNEDWDQLVSSYILDGKDLRAMSSKGVAWSIEKMKAYFSTIKSIKPKLTSSSNNILQAYYKKQRSHTDRCAAQTTPRLLQSLIRLAQAHARLMFRSEVSAIDSIVAISLMESSMLSSNLFPELNALHTTFPDNPRVLYETQASTILKLLNLPESEISLVQNIANIRNAVNKVIEIPNHSNELFQPNLICDDKNSSNSSDQTDKDIEEILSILQSQSNDKQQNVVPDENCGTMQSTYFDLQKKMEESRNPGKTTENSKGVKRTADVQNSIFNKRTRFDDILDENAGEFQSDEMDDFFRNSFDEGIIKSSTQTNDILSPNHRLELETCDYATENEGNIFIKPNSMGARSKNQPTVSDNSLHKNNRDCLEFSNDITTLSELNRIFSQNQDSETTNSRFSNDLKKFYFKLKNDAVKEDISEVHLKIDDIFDAEFSDTDFD